MTESPWDPSADPGMRGPGADPEEPPGTDGTHGTDATDGTDCTDASDGTHATDGTGVTEGTGTTGETGCYAADSNDGYGADGIHDSGTTGDSHSYAADSAHAFGAAGIHDYGTDSAYGTDSIHGADESGPPTAGFPPEQRPEVFHFDAYQTDRGGFPSGAPAGAPPSGAGVPNGFPPAPPPETPPAGDYPGMTLPRPVAGLPPVRSSPPGSGRKRKRRFAVGGGAAAVLLVIAAGVIAYAVLHTRGSPQQVAQAYLSGWQDNDWPGMQKVSIGVPAGGLSHTVGQAQTDLGVHSKTLQLGTVSAPSSGTAHATYTAELTLGNGIHWTYRGNLQLVNRNRHWWVAWSDAAIYPQLDPGDRFQVNAQWLPRAPVFGADGARLDSAQAQQESGSVGMITGSVGPLTAAQAKQLGPPYQAGAMAGQGGVEQSDERQLAGTPRTLIQIVDSHGNVQHTLASFGGRPGTAVKTSIDMKVQQAASRAVGSANVGNKPVALVAIRPSTGEVLAVVNKPGGFDRALQGTYPPGSTFKMVTASALAENGMRPSNSVQCPATMNINGQNIHNYDYEKLGTTDLLTAFAISCNTTFAQLGSQQLTGGKLGAMAEKFGFNSTPELGIPAALGHFTEPTSPTDLAMDSFGQGEDLVDPLQLASVAATLDNGTWRSPRLVLDPAPAHMTPPRPLDSTITSVLRPMMAAVVSQGTAAHVGFPPGVYGKTGTAEYGSGKNPPSHAWFAGYQGDLAFAVIVEGGGVGADASGPIANAFLRGL